MYAFGILGSLLLLAGAWLLITGKNLPGWLGRGLTKDDNLRMKRAPTQFFRAVGAMCVSGGLFGLFSVWIVSIFPQPSLTSLAIMDVVITVFVVLTSASVAWTIVIAARYELFRWSKP